MKKIDLKDLKDPHKIIEYIKQLEKKVEQPLFDHNRREDIKVSFRTDEQVAPAMFKSDPLIPGGYIANTLTLMAMRSDLFIFGEDTDDLKSTYNCACGKELDVQFWKFCPYCSREFHF